MLVEDMGDTSSGDIGNIGCPHYWYHTGICSSHTIPITQIGMVEGVRGTLWEEHVVGMPVWDIPVISHMGEEITGSKRLPH